MSDRLKNIEEKFFMSGFSFDKNLLEKFIGFYDMLIEKNKVINLTTITDFDDVILKHFIDSMIINKCIDFSNVKRIIDVGTGAGFPGIPLKLLFPDIEIVLMDSLNKRVKFLLEVKENLNLKNIEIVHSRAEDLSKKESYREKFDLAVSRAVANLSTLSEYCLPFVKVGGKFVSYKSENITEEIDNANIAVKILGGELDKVKMVGLDNEIRRSFVIINKVKNTSKKYPRKAGTPSNDPL